MQAIVGLVHIWFLKIDYLSTIKQCNRLSYTPLGILYQVWKSRKDTKTISLSTFPARVHCIIEKRRTWISKCSEYWECNFIFCWCEWKIINSTLSIRIYLNGSIVLLPTILLSLHCSTQFRTFQSLSMKICSWAYWALIWLVWIALASLIMFSAISMPVALLISNKYIFKFYPHFSWKAFERQQLDQIWPYMWSFTIWLSVHNLI